VTMDRTVAGDARVVVSDVNVTSAGFRADDDWYRMRWIAAERAPRAQRRDRDRNGGRRISLCTARYRPLPDAGDYWNRVCTDDIQSSRTTR
jgi:hypothetical protein